MWPKSSRQPPIPRIPAIQVPPENALHCPHRRRMLRPLVAEVFNLHPRPAQPRPLPQETSLTRCIRQIPHFQPRRSQTNVSAIPRAPGREDLKGLQQNLRNRLRRQLRQQPCGLLPLLADKARYEISNVSVTPRLVSGRAAASSSSHSGVVSFRCARRRISLTGRATLISARLGSRAPAATALPSHRSRPTPPGSTRSGAANPPSASATPPRASIHRCQLSPPTPAFAAK